MKRFMLVASALVFAACSPKAEEAAPADASTIAPAAPAAIDSTVTDSTKTDSTKTDSAATKH